MVTLPLNVNGIWERTAGKGEKETAVTPVTGVIPNVHPRRGHEGPEGEETSALDGGGWSTPGPGRFTTGNDPVLIV
jgi:hypothetical protein